MLDCLDATGCTPQRSGDEWAARCPAHDDHTPSLTIREGGDGRVLLRCHAGCDWRAVLQALGLPPEAIAAPAPPTASPERREVARYRYRDERGAHQFDVVRFEPKSFSQQPASGRRGPGAMEGVRRVPYQLPELLEAIRIGAPVYVCEGEKDVEVIRETGAVATTNPGGAGKWRGEYSAYFDGATVVVVADRDEPGRRHARHVIAQLREFARSVHGVEPPAGRTPAGGEIKDVADHLAAGRTLVDLVPLLEDMTPKAGSVVVRDRAREEIEVWSCRDLSEQGSVEVPCLVRGLWPEGSLGFISGPAKARKTWLALHFALCISAGRPVLGRFPVPRPVPVLYVALEGHRSAMKQRWGCLARGLHLDPDAGEPEQLYWAYKPLLDLADRESAARLARAAERVDAGLVVIDVLREAARIEENSAKEFGSVRAHLAELFAGRSVALLHHFGKLSELTNQRAPAERMSGTGAMRGAADVGVYLTTGPGNPVSRVTFETRDLAPVDPIGFRLDGAGSGPNGGFLFRDSCSFAIEELPDENVMQGEIKAFPEEIAEFVGQGGGGQRTPGEIKNRFGISDDTLRRRRRLLEEHGVIYIDAGKDSIYRLAQESIC